MNKQREKIDWSKKCWKEMLIYQRKSMWLEDTVEKLASWMDLKPGMTAVDVGCGLGYLGYTYWLYFGEGGRYFGVDISLKLLQESRGKAKEWATGGTAYFTTGDAYRLPFPDDFADCVMCSVLLIHLEKPQLALAEMVRVAKPGGLIMCKEPDNVSPAMGPFYSSLPELGMEELLLRAKVYLICNKGRIARGQGDNSLGPEVPRMMKELGLTEIGIRNNDKVSFLELPYEGPLQQHWLQYYKKQWLDEKRRKTWIDREEKEFLAGGGNLKEYERYREIEEKRLNVMRWQIENGEFFICTAGDFYVIKGRKPK